MNFCLKSHPNIIKLHILIDCLNTIWNRLSIKKLLLSLRAMSQHHNGAIRNDSMLPPGLRTLGLFDVISTLGIRNTCYWSIRATISLKKFVDIEFYASEKAPCEKCIDKNLYFLLKHRVIIATVYWILLLKHSFVIWQGQPCSHAFQELKVQRRTNVQLMCETKIDPSILPFIACVIRMTALLQVSDVFLRIC